MIIFTILLYSLFYHRFLEMSISHAVSITKHPLPSEYINRNEDDITFSFTRHPQASLSLPLLGKKSAARSFAGFLRWCPSRPVCTRLAGIHFPCELFIRQPDS